MIRALGLMLKWLRVLEEKQLGSVRRYRGEREQVGGVVSQLDKFAHEYRAQMLNQAGQGATAAELLATLDFERKLASTAESQKWILGQIENNFSHATQKAIELRMRAEVVQKVLDQKRAQMIAKRVLQDGREIEESIAARQMISGMNTASDRTS